MSWATHYESVRCASSFSTNPDLRHAASEACGAVLDELDSHVDLAFVFFSIDYLREPSPVSLQAVASELVERMGTGQLLGCCGESIVANQYELQWQPAFTLWAASFDDSEVETFSLNFEPHGGEGAFVGWPDSFHGDWPPGSAIIMLADPFSFPADVFLNRINEDRPGVPVYGGMASGTAQPGETRMILGDQVLDSGMIAARISGDFRLRSIVSQGCRPIGTPLVITRAERNEIQQLGGQPALQQLESIFQTLPVRDKQMVNQGLHVGRVISEYSDRYQQGDFLIRNVVNIDRDSGAIAIADYVRPGQTIQFQVRDHETAHVEFRQMLNRVAARSAKSRGGLLFTCNGRGTRLFSAEHHDSGLIRETLGAIPLSGFFAAGEAGPVGGKNFLHGFTASLLLFE